MDFHLQRVLRTPHSERFLLLSGSKEIAALDLHYLPAGKVDATVVVIEGGGVTEQQVPELLQQIDDRLLPDVNLKDHSLSFTVVIGRVLGAFLPDRGEH